MDPELNQNTDNQPSQPSVPQQPSPVANPVTQPLTQPYTPATSKFNPKSMMIIGGVIAGLVILGIGGWFGYRYFKNSNTEITEQVRAPKTSDELLQEAIDANTVDTSKIEITNVGYWVDANATMMVFGFIENKTGGTIGEPKLNLRSIDKNGSVLYNGYYTGPQVMENGEKIPFVSSMPTNSIFEQIQEGYVKDERLPVDIEIKALLAEDLSGTDKEFESTIYKDIKVLKESKKVDILKNPYHVLTLEIGENTNLRSTWCRVAGFDKDGKLVVIGSEDPTHKSIEDYRVLFPTVWGDYEKAVRFEYYFSST